MLLTIEYPLSFAANNSDDAAVDPQLAKGILGNIFNFIILYVDSQAAIRAIISLRIT